MTLLTSIGICFCIIVEPIFQLCSDGITFFITFIYIFKFKYVRKLYKGVHLLLNVYYYRFTFSQGLCSNFRVMRVQEYRQSN